MQIHRSVPFFAESVDPPAKPQPHPKNEKVSAHTKGLVAATSRREKSHRVNWPFLLQNLVAGTNFN